MYHRVAELDLDPYRLAVTPDRFARQVAHLARLRCVVPLGEVLRPSRAARIAITFDDGYLDNATVAAPLLADAGLPATWFITSGRLGGQRFWWDRLAHALLGPHPLPPAVDVRVGDASLWLDLRDDAARDVALRFLHRRLRPLPPDRLEAAISALLSDLATPEAPPDELSMRHEHVRALAADPLFEVGAHTLTHLQLSGQEPALQRREIFDSVGDLSTLLDREVTSFAFPFGSDSAVGPLAPQLAREAGCRLACSTRHDRVTANDDPFLLPRIAVGDWEPAELERVLAEVLQ
jgi:peptidoglycan/xylan/chitin deacetylase (PgdA/CDA1 family)